MLITLSAAAAGGAYVAVRYFTTPKAPKSTFGFPEAVAKALRQRSLLSETGATWQKDNEILVCGPYSNPGLGLKGSAVVYEVLSQDHKEGGKSVVKQRKVVCFTQPGGRGHVVEMDFGSPANSGQILDALNAKIKQIVAVASPSWMTQIVVDGPFVKANYQGEIPDAMLTLLKFQNDKKEDRWISVREFDDVKSSGTLLVCHDNTAKENHTLSQSKFISCRTSDQKESSYLRCDFEKGKLVHTITEDMPNNATEIALNLIGKVPPHSD